MAEKLTVLDYLIFVIVMAVTALIGLYHAFGFNIFKGKSSGREKTTAETIILGDRGIHYIPLALSIFVSYQSSDSALGKPYLTLYYGFVFIFNILGHFLTAAIMVFVYIPVYYRLELTSLYQYLDIRFKKKALKIIGITSFILHVVNYCAIVLYAPSQAFVSILGFDLWTCALSIGITCTVYTALGGMKAVIWTDAFQALFLIFGMMAFLIQGAIAEGGINKVWKFASEGGRTKIDNFNLDPRDNYTVWTRSIGLSVIWLTYSAASQITVQRVLSASSLRNAQKAFWLSVPVFWIWTIVVYLVGFVLYSRYHDCDPLKTEAIEHSYTEFLPHYAGNVLNKSGLAGLLISIAFCGSLSTFSSGLSSLAAVTLEDILKEIFPVSKKRETFWLKLLVFIYGVVIMIYALAFLRFEAVYEVAHRAIAMPITPLLGLITLGICFKQANWKGGLIGWIVGVSFMLWRRIGVVVVEPKDAFPTKVNKTTTACLNMTPAAIDDTAVQYFQPAEYEIAATYPQNDSAPSRNIFYDLYLVFYFWEALYAILLIILVGVAVSYCTGGEDQENLNPESVINYREVFCSYRYKIDPKEDVPNKTDQLQQKPVDEFSEDTGKLTKASSRSKLTQIPGQRKTTTTVKDTGKDTEQLKQNYNVVDEHNINPSEKKDSGVTQLESNTANDNREILHESSNVEETDATEKSSGGTITA